jgi:molybdopterin converting factor small subunit
VERLTTLRYWAALRAAAGTDHDQVQAATLAEALAQVVARHDERFGQVLGHCTLLADGLAVHDPATVDLAQVALVDCLPPFAGG